MPQAVRYCGRQETCLASAVVMLALVTVGHHWFQLQQAGYTVGKLNFPSYPWIKVGYAIKNRWRKDITSHDCHCRWRQLRGGFLHQASNSCAATPRLLSCRIHHPVATRVFPRNRTHSDKAALH